MIFERGRHTQHNFILCEHQLEVVKSFKYLGTHLFKNGSWYRTQSRIAQYASYALHNLFIIFNQIELTNKDKCNLFDSLVGSVLNYNAPIWGNHESKAIELIHCKFLRKVLGVKKSTNLEGLYGEVGRVPMKIYRKLLMIKYWIKILTSTNVLIRKVYFMLSNDANQNITYNNMNWAYQIKHILEEVGLADIWINQTNIVIPYYFIKQRILDIYKQSWYTNINNSNRLSSYCLFKHTFNFEKYLECINERKYQIALSKFRLSSHQLAIETGRYTNVDRRLRICQECNMRMIENEYHFLLVCPKYSELRTKYFKPYYCRWPSIQKFITLLSCESSKSITNVAKFIYSAFQLRNTNNNV
jgi:hypothetical protein